MSSQEKFNKTVSEKALDNSFYGQMTEFANNFTKQKQSSTETIQQPNNVKKRGAFYRWRTTENLDKYLIEFESNFLKKGGKVIWAPDEKDVQKELALLLAKYNNYDIEVSHSEIFEEAGLYNLFSNRAYHAVGIGAAMLGEKRDYSHPLFPIAHIGKEKARRQFFNTIYEKIESVRAKIK